MLQRLVVANSEKIKKATSMDNKVQEMSNLALKGSAKDKEQQQQVSHFTTCVFPVGVGKS